MYERPVVTLVGKVTDVVLGIAWRGSDLDGSFCPSRFDSAEETEGTEDWND